MASKGQKFKYWSKKEKIRIVKKVIEEGKSSYDVAKEENISFLPIDPKLKQMDEQQKVDYFNNLVKDKNETKYDIKIQDFNFLTENIQQIDKNQFNYMLNYYKRLQSKGDSNSKYVFSNVKNLDNEMLKQFIDLKDYSIDYLNDNVKKDIVNRILLYDEQLKRIEEVEVINEEFLNEIRNQEELDKDETKKYKSLIKSKETFYLIDHNLHKEVRIRHGTRFIENSLFEGQDIEKVFIPSTVTEIENKAFYQCSQLTSISLECIDLLKIGESVFSGCVNLVSFKMPDKIKKIEKFTFRKCKKLESIVFSSNLVEIKENAFYKCSSLKEAILPKTIQELGDGCFSKCESLEKVVIPGILYICENDKEFNDLYSVEKFVEPSFSISSKCFFKCANIHCIFATENCRLINENAFAFCSKLESFSFVLSNGSEIKNSAFLNCEQIKKVDFVVKFDDCSLKIDTSSFENCYSLEKV